MIIELDFDHIEQARATSVALKDLFGKIEGQLIFGGQIKLLTVTETGEL